MAGRGSVSSAGGPAAEAPRLDLVAGVSLLRPEEQVFDAMLAGWTSQQLARNLRFGTIENRQRAVQAFAAHAGCLPWQWSAQLVDDWCTDLRAVHHLAPSTVRNYTEAVRLLCGYLTDPAYEWAAECETRFGTYPVQVCHEWNTAVHPGDRVRLVEPGLHLGELEAFFDYTDEQVEAIRSAGRKGWWPASAMRLHSGSPPASGRAATSSVITDSDRNPTQEGDVRGDCLAVLDGNFLGGVERRRIESRSNAKRSGKLPRPFRRPHYEALSVVRRASEDTVAYFGWRRPRAVVGAQHGAMLPILLQVRSIQARAGVSGP